MTSRRSEDDSKFLEIARQVIRDERVFLEEIGRLGIPEKRKTVTAR